MCAFSVKIENGAITAGVDGLFRTATRGDLFSDRACGSVLGIDGGFQEVIAKLTAGVIQGIARGNGIRYDFGSVGVSLDDAFGRQTQSINCGENGLGTGDIGGFGDDRGDLEEDRVGAAKSGEVRGGIDSGGQSTHDAFTGVGETFDGLPGLRVGGGVVAADGISCEGFKEKTELGGVAQGCERVVNTADASAVKRDRAAANKVKRKAYKDRKRAKIIGSDWRSGRSGECGDSPSRYVAGLVNSECNEELTQSVRRKWVVKNELEIAKAERELAVLKGVDVEDVVRRQNVAVRAAIERGIVSIEKNHASLRGKDCHSSDDETRVETILSGVKSDSISPDSSASRSEYMRQKKLCEDKDVELAVKDKAIQRLTEKLRDMGVDVTGVEDVAKSEWTVDVSGQVIQEHQLKFSDYGYNWTTGFNEPRLCADGKERIRVDFFD